MAKPKGDDSKLGLMDRKIDPRLRLLANGDENVCKARAATDAALAVDEQSSRGEIPIKAYAAPDSKKASRKKPKKGKIKKPVSMAKVSVFINRSGERSHIGDLESKIEASRGMISTAVLPLDEIVKTAQHAEVTSIEVGDRVRVPPVILSHDKPPVSKPSFDERKVKAQSRRHNYGRDVLVGIIDVGGIAYAHQDFLTKNKKTGDMETRIERIWDMGALNSNMDKDIDEDGNGEFRKSPQGFDYGVELKREHLNVAIKAAKAVGVSPYAIEPQCHQSSGSHGTHTASIAAGNRGVCRRSPIACVMLDLAPEDEDRRRSFYDSVRIAHAVDYLLNVARELGEARGPNMPPLPLAINISLGTNGHAHDGSSAVSRWIDNALVVPGRVVCVAAGNSGQEAPSYPGDLGYIMGRIHSSGQVKSRGLSNSMDWVVVGNGISDLSENEMEIWYEPQDRFSVTVETPGPNSQKIGPVAPGEVIENRQLNDGTFISIYNELYRPANGCNTISIYLTPWLKAPYIGIKSGSWRVSLRGDDVRNGHYHAWIERDDPRPIIRKSGVSYAFYPSFFSLRSNVDTHSVSSLACGERILSIGNYHTASRGVNKSSSQGPTRTDRQKPEVLAPGTDVVAANGFAPKDKPWISMTGTSMASPYAAGVAGLMLGVNASLTAAQIVGIMRRTAYPIEDTDYAWKDDNGFGVINPKACVDDAYTLRAITDITDQI